MALACQTWNMLGHARLCFAFSTSFLVWPETCWLQVRSSFSKRGTEASSPGPIRSYFFLVLSGGTHAFCILFPFLLPCTLYFNLILSLIFLLIFGNSCTSLGGQTERLGCLVFHCIHLWQSLTLTFSSWELLNVNQTVHWWQWVGRSKLLEVCMLLRLQHDFFVIRCGDVIVDINQVLIQPDSIFRFADWTMQPVPVNSRAISK